MDYLGSYVEAFLGPNKSAKFVVDHDSAEAVNCPADLLRLIPTTHPVSQVVNSAVQSFHTKHRQGSTTLIAMIWFWHQTLQESRNQGINLSEIFSEIQTVVEDCILYLEKQSFSLEDYFIDQGVNLVKRCLSAVTSVKREQYSGTSKYDSPCNNITLTESIPKTDKNCFSQTHLQHSNVSVKRILLRSRHFQSCDVAEDEAVKISIASNGVSLYDNIPSPPARSNVPTINADVQKLLVQLVQGISHGDEERAALILQAWKNQLSNRHLSKDNHSYRFDIDKFHIVSILGDPRRSAVISGLILPVSESMLGLVAETRTPCRALMLNCDLKLSYRHLGFKMSVKSTLIKHSACDMYSLSEEIMWHKKTLHMIKELGVNLLLVRGRADPTIVNSCLSAKVVVIENISVRILNCLSSASSVPMSTYLDDCDESNILCNLILTPWQLDPDTSANETKLESHILVQISCVQTAVLYAPCHPLAYLQEHRLWHIAHRLASVTVPSGKMVAGGGKTESSCVKWMKQICATTVEMKCAIGITVSVFQKFMDAVERNRALGDSVTDNLVSSVNLPNTTDVIDDCLSKVEAWRSSLVVAYLIANTQSVIYVGGQRKNCASLLTECSFEDL